MWRLDNKIKFLTFNTKAGKRKAPESTIRKVLTQISIAISYPMCEIESLQDLNFNFCIHKCTANVLTITTGTGNCGVPAGKNCIIYGKDSADFLFRDPAISTHCGFYGQNICSVVHCNGRTGGRQGNQVMKAELSCNHYMISPADSLHLLKVSRSRNKMVEP